MAYPAASSPLYAMHPSRNTGPVSYHVSQNTPGASSALAFVSLQQFFLLLLCLQAMCMLSLLLLLRLLLLLILILLLLLLLLSIFSFGTSF